MMASKMTNRGGSRVKPGPQSNNTSGLLGITFRWSGRIRVQGRITYSLEACVAVGKKRHTIGMMVRPARDVLRQAIALRRAAGLPVPTLAAAVRAFEDWDSDNSV